MLFLKKKVKDVNYGSLTFELLISFLFLQNLERAGGIAPLLSRYYGLNHRFLSVVFDQPFLRALSEKTEQVDANYCLLTKVDSSLKSRGN